jgi:hypothetical protein
MKSRLLLYIGLVFGVGLFSDQSGSCLAAIVYPQAPAEGRKVVSENVAPILKEHPQMYGGVTMEDLTFGEAHRWYNVGVADLAGGRLLDAATSHSWRYPLMHGTNDAGMATVVADGNTLKYSAFYDAGSGKRILEALRRAEALPQIKKQEYEFRFLSVAGLNWSAVWLHAKADDIIIALPETFRRFKDYQICSESEVIKVLNPEAKRVMKEPRLIR